MMARLRLRRRLRERAGGHPADPQALLADLAASRRGFDYGDADRRRDFRAVFLGAAAGRRVLYEILAWSRVFASTFVPGDAYATHWREGGRDVGLRILAVLDADRAMPDAASVATASPDEEKGARP